MAFYTTQVRTICESALGYTEHAGFDNLNDTLRRSAPLVFNFDFPIWDENYRLTLETKILKHYYMREIGAETVGLWKLWLDERLNLIMPYYNELYKTTVMEFNPYYDVDLTTVHQGDNKRDGNNVSNETGENESNSKRLGTNSKQEQVTTNRNGEINNTGESHDVHQGGDVSRYSDTPQGSIKDLEKDKYLTNATINSNQYTDDNTNKNKQTNKDDAKSDTTNTGKFNEENDENSSHKITKVNQEAVKTTEQYVNKVYGANGNRTYTSKVLEFRTALINIDKMIIEELADLFLGLWN